MTLKMFFAADLTQSTEMKQTDLVANPSMNRWIKVINSFFEEFSNIATRDYEDFRLWKSKGDEIIYITDIEELGDIAQRISSYIRLVNDFVKQSDVITLDRIKMYSWIVDPSNENCEELKLNPLKSEKLDADYVSALMDMGFRLGEYAETRKLLVSIDVASVLMEKIEELNFKLYRKKNEVVFKGAIAGNKLPVFWVDIGTLLHQSKECSIELDSKIINNTTKKTERESGISEAIEIPGILSKNQSLVKHYPHIFLNLLENFQSSTVALQLKEDSNPDPRDNISLYSTFNKESDSKEEIDTKDEL